jgi:DNA-directed RNA polymerase specialized sigma24 family protein
MITQTGQLRLQVGGTVNPRTSIYIVRPSDDELLRLLQRGEYANVLCSRQMGKSSLLVRTKARLHEQGYATAAIDVAGYLGTMGDADEWYQGLLDGIAHQLRLGVDVAEWWKACRAITPNQRLIQFFRDEIAAKTSAPVVIFLDEIDSTIALPYTDDFFVAIRAMYNDRASEPLFERITFCLVGVATPNELIKSRRTTPYNIGRTIELPDFDPERDDLSPLFLAMAVDPLKGEALVQAVLQWTGGHPYLTLRLCDQLLDSGRTSPAEVERMISQEFANLDELHSDVHFQQALRFLDERVEDKETTLNLYLRIWGGEQVRDQTTPAHIALKLAGIVKRNRRGCLIVRNPIYARVFNEDWVAKALEFKPGFERLLEGLHPDRDMAAGEYALLHRRLVSFFAQRDSTSPEDLADKTLDRVADRMEKGEVIIDLTTYCLGVARRISMESRTASGKVSFDDLPAIAFDLTPEKDLLREELDKQKLDCLKHCLRELKDKDREFMTRYYSSEGDRDKSRKALAAELGMSDGAMRVRVSRIRARLSDCVRHCMEKSSQ